MRKFKVFLWIMILFLLQTTALARIHIFQAVPFIIMPYAVCVAILDDDFDVAAIIGIVCAVLAGSLCGREFTVVTLFMVFAVLIVNGFRNRPAYISGFFKSVFWTFLLSGVFEIVCYAVENINLTVHMLLFDALPTAVINTLMCVIIYPLLKKIMYKKEEKKLLLGDLV